MIPIHDQNFQPLRPLRHDAPPPLESLALPAPPLQALLALLALLCPWGGLVHVALSLAAPTIPPGPSGPPPTYTRHPFPSLYQSLIQPSTPSAAPPLQALLALAARLQQERGPQTILLQEATYRCLGEGFAHLSPHISFQQWCAAAQRREGGLSAAGGGAPGF